MTHSSAHGDWGLVGDRRDEEKQNESYLADDRQPQTHFIETAQAGTQQDRIWTKAKTHATMWDDLTDCSQSTDFLLGLTCRQTHRSLRIDGNKLTPESRP